MRIVFKIAALAIGATLLTTITLMLIGGTRARTQYLAGIDRQLTTAAAAVPVVIGDDYLRGAGATRSMPDAEYTALVTKLSDLADKQGVVYLYVFAADGDQFLNLATSASAAERKDASWAKFLEPYKKPPAQLRQTAADGVTRFAEYSDEFGAFRSIFVRHDAAAGVPAYIVGVDVSLEHIHDDLLALLLRGTLGATLVTVGVAIVCVFVTRRIVAPLQALSREVDAWAGRDFAQDENIRRSLQLIGTRHRDEVGDLARRFVDVQDRLLKYLLDLTRATADKQRIQGQLEIAKTIQESLLPMNKPSTDRFNFYGWCQSADETGGDYFDWIELADGQIMLTIGDVTGHGIGPALVTAASRAYGRATLDTKHGLSQLVGRLNDLLHTDLQGIRFVTLIAGLLDPKAREMTVVAAGHGPLMFYSKRRDALDIFDESQGVPLGVFPGVVYDPPVALTFEPGDILTLVSDGFLDWMDPTGETFGTERVCKSVLDSCRIDPEKIVDRLRADIDGFNQGRKQGDDTTALVIRCIA